MKLYTKSEKDNGDVIFETVSEIEEKIQEYENLQIAGKTITSPYYINTARKRDLRALMGKGTAEEMIQEIKVWAQVKKVDLKDATSQEIRELMKSVGIGIDCSGLVCHVLDNYLRIKKNGSLYSKYSYKRKGLRASIARLLRPVENLGADDLTSLENSKALELEEVRPGDLIRGVGKRKNAYHVAIVTKVKGKDVEGKFVPEEIEYVHSHRMYGDEHGIRRKSIKIISLGDSFLEQDWSDDEHTDGRNYMYEDIAEYPDESGFRRPHFYEKIK